MEHDFLGMTVGMTDEAIKQRYLEKLKIPKDETHIYYPPSQIEISQIEIQKMLTIASTVRATNIHILSATPIDETPFDFTSTLEMLDSQLRDLEEQNSKNLP